MGSKIMPIILRTKFIGALWTLPNGCALPNSERNTLTLRLQQAEYVSRNPALSDPREIATEKLAFIGNGCWRIHCECGEATHTDPEWGIACCFGCGAIWTNVVFPENWRAIEDLLVQRRLQASRNWEAPETIETLTEEQIAHGEPV